MKVDVRKALGYVHTHRCTGKKIHIYIPYEGADNEMHVVSCAKCDRVLNTFVKYTLTYS